MDKEIGSEKKDKPALNEEILGKLLEAAYVLQEHNRRTREMELGVAWDEPSPVDPAELWVPQTSSAAQSAPVSPINLPAQEQVVSPDYTATLAQIMETQHQIQLRNLKLQDAMTLVAARVREIAAADGSAIATVKGKKLLYRATNGEMGLPLGTEVSMEKALCSACVRTGQVIRAANINAEFLLDNRECQRRGIQSMIAVPVYHEGEIAGALEVYYLHSEVFTEQDVHTCQLMAGLITEALARDEEMSWKQSLASERAVVLKALERPNPGATALDEVSMNGIAGKETSAFTCRKCGHRLVGEERFCGKCGMARPTDPAVVATPSAPRRPMPEVNSAALGHSEETLGEALAEAGRLRSGKLLAESIEHEVPGLFASTSSPGNSSLGKSGWSESSLSESSLSESSLGESSLSESSLRESSTIKSEPATFGSGAASLGHSEPRASSGALVRRPLEIRGDSHLDLESDAVAMRDNAEMAPSTSLAPEEPGADWSSAARARSFLQQLASGKPDTFARFWRARRGDIYLAAAGILVVAVIGWGIRSDHSVGAANPAKAEHQKTPDADLSVLDRMLISLGLAEAPQAPESKGNPDAQVWVDLHTALYYCPGADLYGKTPKGKYTTQRDAQLDQFEPAYRKACD